jgi:hypothetical protein
MLKKKLPSSGQKDAGSEMRWNEEIWELPKRNKERKPNESENKDCKKATTYPKSDDDDPNETYLGDINSQERGQKHEDQEKLLCIMPWRYFRCVCSFRFDLFLLSVTAYCIATYPAPKETACRNKSKTAQVKKRRDRPASADARDRLG